MHVLGLACGSFGGNSEVLLKVALTAAIKGNPEATTSWIHIPSVSIPPNPKPLKGSVDVSMGQVESMQAGSFDTQNIPDDRLAVFNAILDADAIIIATPVWSHQPPGALKAVIDRVLGPYVDYALTNLIIDGKRAGDPKFTDTPWPDKRIMKPRVAGFMCVSGSRLTDQTTQALLSMHTLLYPLHVKVVDQHIFAGFGNPGTVLASEGDQAVHRADNLGKAVASQMGKAFDQAEYLGPHEDGACPHCHLSKIDFFHNRQNVIGCLGCGCEGKLEVQSDGYVKPVWDFGSDASCITMKGKTKHVYDILEAAEAEKGRLQHAREELERKKEEWKNVKFPSVQLPSQPKL